MEIPKSERFEQEAKEIGPYVEVQLRETLELLRPLLEEGPSPMSHYQEFCLLYLGRMYGHATSVLNLGRSRDLRLIQRTGLEGMLLFEWVAKDASLREKRAKQYLSLRVVGLSNTIRGAGLLQSDIREEWRAIVLEKLPLVAEDILAAGEYNDLMEIAGERTPKGVLDYLLKVRTVRGLFNEIEAGEFYNLAYATLSEYHHWEPATFPSVGSGVSILDSFMESTQGVVCSQRDLLKMVSTIARATLSRPCLNRLALWSELNQRFTLFEERTERYEWL